MQNNVNIEGTLRHSINAEILRRRVLFDSYAVEIASEAVDTDCSYRIGTWYNSNINLANGYWIMFCYIGWVASPYSLRMWESNTTDVVNFTSSSSDGNNEMHVFHTQVQINRAANQWRIKFLSTIRVSGNSANISTDKDGIIHGFHLGALTARD